MQSRAASSNDGCPLCCLPKSKVSPQRAGSRQNRRLFSSNTEAGHPHKIAKGCFRPYEGMQKNRGEMGAIGV